MFLYLIETATIASLILYDAIGHLNNRPIRKRDLRFIHSRILYLIRLMFIGSLALQPIKALVHTSYENKIYKKFN